MRLVGRRVAALRIESLHAAQPGLEIRRDTARPARIADHAAHEADDLTPPVRAQAAQRALQLRVAAVIMRRDGMLRIDRAQAAAAHEARELAGEDLRQVVEHVFAEEDRFHHAAGSLMLNLWAKW